MTINKVGALLGRRMIQESDERLLSFWAALNRGYWVQTTTYKGIGAKRRLYMKLLDRAEV